MLELAEVIRALGAEPQKAIDPAEASFGEPR
jgi:hypothetical protein